MGKSKSAKKKTLNLKIEKMNRMREIKRRAALEGSTPVLDAAQATQIDDSTTSMMCNEQHGEESEMTASSNETAREPAVEAPVASVSEETFEGDSSHIDMMHLNENMEVDEFERTESPAKDMKKKMAANAEKEKNAAEQTTSKQTEKPADKPGDKPGNKSTEKSAEKPADKAADKPQKADKAPEKPAEKKQEKAAEKKDGQSEKKKEENGKGESSAKPDKNGKPDTKPKQNGSSNGVNGTVSPESDSDELVIDEADETELFPELAYDDSDVEWEGTDCPSRSLTRRSQVKVTRTPETPRPASDKDAADDSKDSKVVKVADAAKADTPVKKDAKDAKEAKKEQKEAKDAKKTEAKEGKQDGAEVKADAKKDVKESPRKEDKKEEKSDKVEVEVVVDIESTTDPEESRKPDTNFSKSRVKVSPYRRSMRLADQTTSSIAANYTGNNTTMEMDITESSLVDDSMDNSSYLSGLRAIKGRSSYKLLQDMPRTANRSVRSVTSTIVTEHSSRPTAPVVGRKRKPEPEDNISVASEAEELPVAGKRQRLLDRLARPFRRTLLPRRNAEIVGINTDLPLTAPVASGQLDPETLPRLKPEAVDLAPAPAAPAPLAAPGDDPKRCILM